MSWLLISLDDAYAAVGSPARTAARDEDLLLHIAAATAIIEDLTGPLLANTITATVSGRGRSAIPLDDFPSGVTSVTEDGVSLTPGSGFCWDEAGLLWRGSAQGAGCWSAAAPRNVVVVYTVGDAIVPPVAIAAGRELVKWLHTRQQVPRPSPGSTPGVSWTPSGFAVPNAVKELLAPLTAGRMPGMA